MKAQLDFLQRNNRAAIGEDLFSRFPNVGLNYADCFFTKRHLLLLWGLFFGMHFTYGQINVVAKISSPNTNAVDVCAGIPLQIEATPMSSTMPLIWKAKNNNGTFSDSLNHTTTYTPNAVTGNSRLDEIIVTLDQGYASKWQDFVGVDTTGGLLKCTIPGQGNSGARSVDTLAASTDGWVEAKLTSAIQAAFGLSATNLDNTPLTINFGIQIAADQNKAFVIENGNPPSNFTPVSLSAGDNIFRVERVGNTILYKHNRTVFHTATVPSTSALFVDVSMATVDEVLDITVSFGDDTYIFPADTITVQVLKALSLDIGLDKEICEGDSTTVSLSTSGAFDRWETTNGIFNSDTRTFTPTTPLNVLTRIDSVIAFTFPASNSVCPAVSDTVLVTVRQTPAIEIMADNELCEGDSMTVNLAISGAELDQWETNNGTFTTTSYKPNSLSNALTRIDSIIAFSTPAPNNTCPAVSDTVFVAIRKAPAIAMVADGAMCEGDTISLTTTPSQNADTVFWSGSGGTFTTIAGQSNAIKYAPSGVLTTATRKDLVYVATNSIYPICPTAKDTTEITVHWIDEVANAFSTATICEGDTIEMKALLTKAATQINWTKAASAIGTLQKATDTNAVYQPSGLVDSIRYDTLFVTTIPTGSFTCKAAIDTVIITVLEIDRVQNAFATTTICEGDSIKMNATLSGAATKIKWTTLHNTGTFINSDDSDAIYIPNLISDTLPTNRVDTLMAITVPLTSCHPDTAFVSVNVRNAPQLAAIADVTICDLKEIVLETTKLGPGALKMWSVTPSLSSTFSDYQNDSLKVTYTPTNLANNATAARIDTVFFLTHDTSAVCPAYKDSLFLTINPTHQVTISPSYGLNAADLDTIPVCEGNSTDSLMTIIGGGTTTVRWSMVANSGSFDNVNALKPIYTPNIGLTNNSRYDTLIVSSQNSVTDCPIARDSIIIHVQRVATATMASDTIVCEIGTVQLSANATGFGDTLFWQILNGTGQFENTTIKDTTTIIDNTVLYEPTGDVTTQFRMDTILYATVNPQGVCPAVEDSIFIAVYNTPTVEVNDPNKTTDTLYVCEGIGLPLNGSYSGGAIGATWSVLNNVGEFSEIVNDTMATYTPFPNPINTNRVDTIILTPKVITGTCSNTAIQDTLFVIVQAGPIVTAVEDSLSVCADNSIVMEGTFGSVATGFTWSTKVAGSGNIEVLTNTTARYTPTGTIQSPGRLDVIYLTSVNGNVNCLTAIDSIEIFVSAKPILELGMDISMCGNLTQLLTPTQIGVGNQLTWSSSNGSFANNPSPTGLYQPNFPVSTYSRIDGIIVSSIDSLELCPTIEDTMLVTVYGLARITIGRAATVCEDDSIVLNPNYAGTLTDFTYTVSNNAGEIKINNNQILYDPVENITLNNRIDRIIINLGDPDGTSLCPVLIDTIDITVLNTPRASLVGDTTICLGDQVNLLTESFGIIDVFQSSLSTSLINYPSTPPTITSGTIQDNIIYRTKLIDEACPSATQQITVTIREPGEISLNLVDTTICEASTLSLNAGLVTPSNYNYQWHLPNQTGSLDNEMIATPIYTPNMNLTTMTRIDTIILEVVEQANKCKIGKDTLLVTIVPNLSLGTLRDTTICEGVNLSLDNSYIGTATDATWSVLSAAGIFSNNDTSTIYTPHVSVTNLNINRVDTLLLTANTIPSTCNTIIQDTMFVFITTGSIVVAVEDSLTMCAGNSILIQGTFNSVAAGVAWSTKVTGSGTIELLTDSTANYTPLATVLDSSRLDVIYLTSTNGDTTCLTVMDSIEIFVAAKPILDLGADVSICGNLTQLLTPAQVGIGNQLTWSSSNGAFSNNPSITGLYQPNLPIPTFSRTDGIIVNSVDSLGICPAVTDTMLVTIYGLARVTIGEEGTVCEDDSLVLNPAYGGTLAGLSYTTSNNTGKVTVSNNQLLYHPTENTTLNNRVDTLIINLDAINDASSCPAFIDTVIITVLNTPRASLIGDTAICLGDQINLLTESFGLVDIFQSKLSTSLINYPSTSPTIANGTIQDTITYQTKLIDGACPVATQQIIVTIGKPDEVVLNLLDTTICEANTVKLSSSLANPSNYTYEWQLLSPMGSLDSDTIASPTYTPNMDLADTARIDTIVLTVVNQSNTCSIGQDTLFVKVIPSATLGDLRDTTICEGDTLDLSITLDGTANFFWSSISGNFADSSQLQTRFAHAPFSDNSSINRISANLTFDNNICNAIQRTINVTILGQSAVFAGLDSTICTGFDFQLAGNIGFGIDSAQWSVIDNHGSFDTIKNLNAIYTPNPLNGIIERTDALVLSTTTPFSCISPVDTLFLTIKPTPSINLGPDYSVVGLSNQILSPSLSESISTARWKAQNGSFINTTPASTTYVPTLLNNDTLRLDTIIYQGFTPLENCSQILDTLIITFRADTAIITDTLTTIANTINSEFCQSFCIDTTHVIIDPNTDMAIVLANNLDPLDTCTVNSDIDFRFWYPALGTPAPIYVTDFPDLPSSITYDCLDRGLQNVNVYVATDSLNIQLCPTVINVEDDALTCGERIISGRITTFRGSPVQGFEVFLQGTGIVGGAVPSPAITDANGRYEITVDANTSYHIRPMNNQNITEGVTAFDNVIISRHILGLQPFDSPYQTIAADANKSGTITAFDIVLIRKVVLARNDSFENNTSWRFIDADFQFMDIISAAAAPFMESFEVTSDMGNVTDMDFIAVKIGDVNDTNSANGGLTTTAESRNDTAPLLFELLNQQIEKGKIYEVPFQLSNEDKVAAYQFTLDFEGLALLNIQPGIATPAHFDTKLAKKGLLTTCWSTPNPVHSTDTWFTLQFKATKNGRLSELLTVNSEITPIEAYTSDAANIGVQLTFKEPVGTTFDLFQNKPNPFKNQTIIGFALPQAAPAKITVMDMQGKILYSIADHYESGYNEIIIQQSQLPKGVFYYRLETAFGTKIQKMMHLE